MFNIPIRLMQTALWLWFSASLIAADLAQLRQFEETKRFFELRRALAQTTSDEPEVRYFRALTEARTGQEAAAIEHLRAFLATNPDQALKRKTHEEIASALMRLGRYKDAVPEWDAVLELMSQNDPERDGTQTGRAICETLRDVAPQTIEFGDDSPVKARFRKPGFWKVPMDVNGSATLRWPTEEPSC